MPRTPVSPWNSLLWVDGEREDGEGAEVAGGKGVFNGLD